jgi:outer membrane lipoprotein-sorting protein
MKKILIGLIVIFAVSFSVPGFAGEKEELQWQISFLMEHIKVLQSEFANTQTELKSAQEKYTVILKAEEDAKKASNKKDKK